MDSYIDQKPRIATEKDCHGQWGARSKPGEGFRCYLCGHRFVPGDVWRFVYNPGRGINFLVCETCDGPDVLDRFREHFTQGSRMLRDEFWWMKQEDDDDLARSDW